MLNDKQKKFCEEYMLEYNGIASYQKAYPKISYATAKTNSSRLLTNANIQTYIEELKGKLSELSGVTALRNINEVKKIAYGKTHKEEEKEKTHDKLKAIELLNKMLGLNAPDALDINDSRDITIKVVHERVNDKTEGTTPSPGTDSK